MEAIVFLVAVFLARCCSGSPDKVDGKVEPLNEDLMIGFA
jgi:hypothetical protein